eukprot:g42695.t1
MSLLRKTGGEHSPIYINGTEVERVKSIRFLGVTITNDLSWTSLVDATVKKAQHHLLFLRQLRKFGLSIRTIRNYRRCTAQTIMEANLPSMDSIYTARCRRKAVNIIKDPSYL